MIENIRNLFFRTSAFYDPGEICICADVSVESDVSFRVDGQKMQVMWGDGEQSRIWGISQQFTHRYSHPGSYWIHIRGENMTALDIPDAHILQLDLSACPTLEYIDCSGNLLKILDLRTCKWLCELKCLNNRLTELKLGTYRKLYQIVCSFNYLEKIDVSGCPNLVEFYCNGNNLEGLDLRNCRKLLTLNIEKNRFTESALLDMITGLPLRGKNIPGLVCLGYEDSYDVEKIQRFLGRKGWFEI